MQRKPPQWLAEARIFVCSAQIPAVFQTASPCSTVPHKIIWPTPIRWQRLSSMIWWWSSPRSSRQDKTASAKPRSPSISQLHRALSLHVKRLLAPVITLRQGTAGNRDRMCCTAVPEQEVEEETLFLLHQAQHDCLCSEPMPDPRRAEILPWPHHTLGLTKNTLWLRAPPPPPPPSVRFFSLYRGQNLYSLSNKDIHFHFGLTSIVWSKCCCCSPPAPPHWYGQSGDSLQCNVDENIK